MRSFRAPSGVDGLIMAQGTPAEAKIIFEPSHRSAFAYEKNSNSLFMEPDVTCRACLTEFVSCCEGSVKAFGSREREDSLAQRSVGDVSM